MKKIAGYINVENEEIDYSTKFLTQPLQLGSLLIDGIEFYHSNKRFDSNSKQVKYGLSPSMSINNRFEFITDIGYQYFYDITSANDLYENSPYFRFMFPIGDTSYDTWYGLSLYVDKNFPVPKIGYVAHIGDLGDIIFELGVYKSLSIHISYRWLFGKL
jgi:hypothetical protein